MATAARDRLARTLRGDEEPASSTELTASMAALTLEVEGVGRLALPVTPAKARKLIGLGTPARFGRGERTLTDTSVRDTWEIPKNLVRATWDPAVLRDALMTVKENLGLPNAAELTVEFHSLLVYEPDQFFLSHQDTEKSDDMIGTLVVTLPSNYAGGELMVGRGEDWKAYRKPNRALSLVAFYADCQHEVLKVKSGYRVTLTYNLLLRGDTAPRSGGEEGTVAELADLLREHFSTPATSAWSRNPLDPPGRLVYLLDHEYTPRALGWTRLKGADARRVPMLREAAERAGCEAILGLADVKTTHDAWPDDDEGYGYFDDDEEDDWAEDDREYDDRDREYTINDLIDTEVTLGHWTGPDGAGLEETSLPVAESEVCASTPHGDLEPYESEYEGYMGNWGNTLDRWYHRGAIVIWPRAKAFANRAETSPGWALDQLIAMADAGDAAGARDAAATLEPVWRDLERARARIVPAPGSTLSVAGLLGQALRAADAVADADTAAMLLKPFTLTNLTGHHTEAFGRVAARYGQDWTADVAEGWFGDSRSLYGRNERQTAWVAASLPGLCAGLRKAGCDGAAQRLLELSWSRVRQDADTGLKAVSPDLRDQRLRELGQPLTGLLAAAGTLRSAGLLGIVSGYIRNLEGDPVTALELACLRAAADLRSAGPGADDEGAAGLGAAAGELRELASDCATRLRDRLERPRREPGDWSMTLPRGGCLCELCQELGEFLGSPRRKVFEWPLAKERRQHVHGRIDAAGLPVTHVTRRQGRPFTLVLTKTDALFTGEREARERDEADLKWLASEWAVPA